MLTNVSESSHCCSIDTLDLDNSSVWAYSQHGVIVTALKSQSMHFRRLYSSSCSFADLDNIKVALFFS